MNRMNHQLHERVDERKKQMSGPVDELVRNKVMRHAHKAEKPPDHIIGRRKHEVKGNDIFKETPESSTCERSLKMNE